MSNFLSLQYKFTTAKAPVGEDSTDESDEDFEDSDEDFEDSDEDFEETYDGVID